MKLEVKIILILILKMTRLAFAKWLKHGFIQKEALPSKECDLIAVSHSRIDRGKILNTVRLRLPKQYNKFALDFGRGAINFLDHKSLLRMIDEDKLSPLTTRMSCLITVAELSNEVELKTLIDIMKEFKIDKKYLFVTIDTYNATMFHETNINFNVMINHREKGLLMFVRTLSIRTS